LSEEQKHEAIDKTEKLFSTYKSEVVDEAFVIEEMYEGSIDFVEQLEMEDQKIKDEMLANLLFEQYFEENELTVARNAIFIDDLVNMQIDENFSLNNTEILSNILVDKENIAFNQSSISDDFLIVSQINNFDLGNNTFSAQFLLAKQYEDEFKIFEQEEPQEFNFELKPSAILDKKQMKE
jgi:hypothetical protein